MGLEYEDAPRREAHEHDANSFRAWEKEEKPRPRAPHSAFAAKIRIENLSICDSNRIHHAGRRDRRRIGFRRWHGTGESRLRPIAHPHHRVYHGRVFGRGLSKGRESLAVSFLLYPWPCLGYPADRSFEDR